MHFEVTECDVEKKRMGKQGETKKQRDVQQQQHGQQQTDLNYELKKIYGIHISHIHTNTTSKRFGNALTHSLRHKTYNLIMFLNIGIDSS